MSAFEPSQPIVLRTDPVQSPAPARAAWSLRISVPLLLGVLADPKLFEHTVLHPTSWWAVILCIALIRSPALLVTVGERV
jgi:hypothetical protein